MSRRVASDNISARARTAIADFVALVPMKRFGKPAELAGSVAFPLSEDAGFSTLSTNSSSR
ncbi:hypothetical protein C0Z16_34830 [Paraburkholderia rhynchosiae]|uniref:Uncharacterized protein n=1 Tax=Paraburkholderia rhynchosiae TaxID=487049 RepID=A0ABX4UTV2_9BURK|nr:hypothetical protein C0Z16_34830 [Paraburkholderia rhynchosiae]